MSKLLARRAITTIPVTGGSSTALPIGNMPGWTQIVADDFNYTYAIGSVASDQDGELLPGCAAYAELHDKFTFYPDGWNTTHGGKVYEILPTEPGYIEPGQPGYPAYHPAVNSKYYPSKTIYFENSCAKVYHHSEDIGGIMTALGAAIKPKLPSGDYMIGPYARWQFRMRSQNVTAAPANSYWHWVPLGIDSNNWPQNGELDWPEGDIGKPVAGNYHPASNVNETYHVTSGEDPTQWNIFTVEWTPGRLKWWCNNALRLNTTDRVPSQPQAFLFQHESDWRQPIGTGIVEIDWVAMWTYTP